MSTSDDYDHGDLLGPDWDQVRQAEVDLKEEIALAHKALAEIQEARIQAAVEGSEWKARALRAEAEYRVFRVALQEELAHCMDERCDMDERHCTCVPPLRAEVKRLRAERDATCICPTCERTHLAADAECPWCQIERLRANLLVEAKIRRYVASVLKGYPEADCQLAADEVAEQLATCRALLRRLQATLDRILHFAIGPCEMVDATRLRCIATECKAEAARCGRCGVSEHQKIRIRDLTVENTNLRAKVALQSAEIERLRVALVKESARCVAIERKVERLKNELSLLRPLADPTWEQDDEAGGGN